MKLFFDPLFAQREDSILLLSFVSDEEKRDIYDNRDP